MTADNALELLGEAVDGAMSPVTDELWAPLLPIVRAELERTLPPLPERLS